MALNKGTAIGAAIGVVMALVGVLAITGVVALSAVSGTGGVGFNVTIAGYNATVTDTTAFSTSLHVSAVEQANLTWGDGSAPTKLVPGGQLTFSHTYSAKGTYLVTDTWVVFELGTKTTSPGGLRTYVASTTIGIPSGVIPPPLKQSTVVASFAYSISGTTISVTDNSIVIGQARIVSVGFAWGVSGASSASIPQGGASSYTYSSAGTYVVTETIDWEVPTTTAGTPGPTEVSSYSANVTVSQSTSCTNCNQGGPGSTTGAGSFNAASGLLLLGGIGIVILSVAPVDIRYRLVSFAGLLILGLGIGWFVGGPGIL